VLYVLLRQYKATCIILDLYYSASINLNLHLKSETLNTLAPETKNIKN